MKTIQDTISTLKSATNTKFKTEPISKPTQIQAKHKTNTKTTYKLTGHVHSDKED